MWVAPDVTAASIQEVVARYWVALRAETPWLLLAVGLFALTWSRWRALESHRAWCILVGAAALSGVALALHLGWVADDAFISFRYARNWVDGVGLVFNAGERVEGYTNFLWIVLISPFQALGFSLPPVSVVLTSACFVLTILAAARFAAQLQRQVPGADAGRWPFPIAAACLALNYTFASFGTSGLETMFATLLVLCAVERAERRAAFSSGILAIGATLAHPDHAIFYACLACVLAVERRFKELVRFGLPFALIYVPYFAWRWSYYGDFFPNTYYVKNAGLSYFSQGARYLALSGLSSGFWLALPLAIYAIWRLRHLRVARFCALALPIFSFYVGKIGGDFMLGRLLCPVLPFVYVLAEVGLRTLMNRGRAASWPRAALGLGAFCTAVVPVRFIKPNEIYAHIADERTFYPIGSYLPFSLDSSYRDLAHAFNNRFRDLSRKPTLAMYSVGIIGYETGLRLVDNAGLNHRAVAHWRNRHRGRPGHEKIISPGLLVQSDADLSDVPVYPEPYESLGRVDVDGVRFHLVKYEAGLVSELALTGIQPPPLLEYVRDYVPAPAPMRLDCDLWYLQQIYFRHNPASPLRRAFMRKLVDARPEWRAHQDVLLAPSPEQVSWRRTHSLDFESIDTGAHLEGDAFEHNPTTREAVGQPPLAGTRGAFIDTFQDDNGDMATGEFTTVAFPISGDLITLNVAGGYNPGRTYVELLVDGEPQFQATGCNSGILGTRFWATRHLRGRSATLRIVDAQRSEFGHIVVDELVQWASPVLWQGAPGSNPALVSQSAASDAVLRRPLPSDGAP